jgi:vacuolar-type H+-ATPase subunit D/Vma8
VYTLVVAVADTAAKVESNTNQALKDVIQWIKAAGLSVAVEKTEAVFSQNKRYMSILYLD